MATGNCYKKNFVKKVIAKVEFASPTDIFTPESMAAAVIEIKRRFTISEQSTASQQGITLTKDGGVQSSKTEFPEWIFHGSDRSKVLKVNKLFIEVVLTKYDSEIDFREDLIVPISHLLKVNPKTIIKRTGIRFINVFDFPIDSFLSAAEYFSNGITEHFKYMTGIDKCSRSFLVNEFVHNDIKMRVQSGFFNPDYPAIIKRNQFLLDFDAYIDFPHLINDTDQYFSRIHDLIEEEFEASITDKLREEILNV